MRSALDAAQAYAARGWVAIPLGVREKRPLLASWPSLRPTAEELPGLFGRHSNVGIHLGPSGVVDVDLDCPEAVRMAPALLPSTPLRFGRDGAPASHWLYRCPGAAYEKLVHERETLAEVRAGEGKQTVMPPSVHPTGQVVRWEAGVDHHADPAVVGAEELSAAVRRLASAVLLVREGWAEASAVATVRAGKAPPNLPGGVAKRVAAWCGWSEPAPQKRVQPSGNPGWLGTDDLRGATEAYLRDHPREWPTRNRACPICGGKGAWKAVPDGSGRWACWSSSHAATGVGVQGSECWMGDALDLDAHRAGVSVAEHLRATGYLVRSQRPPAPSTAPEAPAPTPDVVELFSAAEAAVRAAAEAAGSREVPGSKAQAVAAWTEFVRGPHGLSGLAAAALQEPDRAAAVFDTLEAVYGLGTIAKSARSEFRRLAKAARIEQRRKVANLRVVAENEQAPAVETLDRGDEVEVAKRMIEADLAEHTVYDRTSLYSYRKGTGAWHELEQAVVVAKVHRYAGAPVFAGYSAEGLLKPPQPLKVSHRFAVGVTRFIQDMRLQRNYFETRAAGCGFANGFLRADGAWLPKSHEHRLLESEVLPFDYRPIAHPDEVPDHAPRWHRFLCSLFEGDEDSWAKRTAIQEFIGATMLGLATRYQQALLLYGPRAGNGKSTLLTVLSELFPPASRCSIPPSQMGERHVNVPLATARVNIVNDMPDAEIIDAGHLKAIISGDELQWNPKNLPAFSAAPKAGHVFAANTLPGVRDRSRGFWRRMLIIGLNREFDRGGKDAAERRRDIAYEVLEEREQIAAACLCHALHMPVEGYTVPNSASEVLQEWEHSANNVAEFVSLGWAPVQGAIAALPGPVAYQAYKMMCEEGGVRPLGRNRLYDELKRVGWQRERRDARRWLVAPVAGSEAEALLRRSAGPF